MIRVMEAPGLAAVGTNTPSWRRARLRQIWFGGGVCFKIATELSQKIT